jgi:tetratricopeptide (TPR) repeat protein
VKGLDSVRVPATVQAILAARIDRLAPDDKRLLQGAAAIGTDVPFGLLLGIAGLDEDALRHGLARLQASEFVYEARLFPELEYTFKHALTHEVAYGSLLTERRQALHREVVEAIERLHADRLGEHVERLAHHALRGELRDRALRYLRQAGDRATARSANREAATLFEQALALLGDLPETPEILAEAADARIALATSLVGLKGAAAPEVEASYLHARELAERLGDTTRLYPALWGLWFVNYARGHFRVARELGEQLLAVAESGTDTGRLLEAHHALWPTLYAMGETTAALPHLERGMSLYDPARHGSQAFLYGGHDAGACCGYHLGRTWWLLGYPDRAAAAIHDAVGLAERLAHGLTLVITLSVASYIRYQIGDRDGARKTAERAVRLAQEQELAGWIDDSYVILACAETRAGGDVGRIAELYERVTTIGAATAGRNVLNLCFLAAAFGELGEAERGLDALAAIPEEHRHVVFAPEIQRVRGALLLLRHERDEAERCFRRAIEIARQREERSLELRAATSLARLLDGRGGRDEARAVLAPIYGWFTEGFDTKDLREARALLDTLA